MSRMRLANEEVMRKYEVRLPCVGILSMLIEILLLPDFPPFLPIIPFHVYDHWALRLRSHTPAVITMH